MKFLITLHLLILFYNHSFAANIGTYQQMVTEAQEVIEQQKEPINILFQESSLDRKAMVLAIVFPELLRYSYVQNILETTILEVSYVELGIENVDFSIGPFQMKVSFIEQLEDLICQSKTLFDNHEHLVTFSAESEKDIRQERINRLKCFQTQLLYAMGFYDLLEEHFQKYSFRNSIEKTRYYATCYNAGLDRSPTQIRQLMRRRTFPYGQKYDPLQQCSYADFSAHYFQNIHFSIFQKP